MVLHRSIVNLGVHLPWVDVHSAICETYMPHIYDQFGAGQLI